jgi:hypothetical protein
LSCFYRLDTIVRQEGEIKRLMDEYREVRTSTFETEIDCRSDSEGIQLTVRSLQAPRKPAHHEWQNGRRDRRLLPRLSTPLR